MNKLIHGDNLTALQMLRNRYAGKINLIYIDPPFSTNNTFRISDKRTATISMSNSSRVAYRDTVTGEKYLNDLKARLSIAHDLLADDGSIYLHIDCKVAYDIKNILDDVFRRSNFRNSISRIKSNPKNFSQKGYGSIKDTILFYTKTRSYKWNYPRVAPENMSRFNKADDRGNYTTAPIHAPGETRNGDTGKKWKGNLPPTGRHWRYSRSRLDKLNDTGMIEWSKNGNPRVKVYEADVREKGILLQDVWTFKDPQYPSYPTEKNLDMLQSIVKSSSEPKDIVLDFYCGSGTTLLAAAMNKRRFIGIDESEEAISCCRKRLAEFKYAILEMENIITSA